MKLSTNHPSCSSLVAGGASTQNPLVAGGASQESKTHWLQVVRAIKIYSTPTGIGGASQELEAHWLAADDTDEENR